MAISYTIAGSGTHTAPQTLTVTSTAGNLIIVSMSENVGVTIASITDNKSNTYVSTGISPIPTDSGATANSEIWYAKNATTGVTSITINGSVNNGTKNLHPVIYDVSGADTVAPLIGVSGLSSQTATTNPVGPAITNNGTGGLVISNNSPTNAITAVAGPFTLDSTLANNGYAAVANAAIGSFSPSWTQNVSGTWCGITAVFQAPGGAAAINMVGNAISGYELYVSKLDVGGY